MSRKVTALGVCLVAMFALAGLLSTVTSAAEMLLPVFSAPSNGMVTSGKDKLTIAGGASILCTKDRATLTFRAGSNHEGTATIDCEGATQGGESCNSKGDAAGVVLASGTFNLVLRTISAKDRHLLDLTLSTAVTIECSKSAVKLLVVSGGVLGEIEAAATEPTTKYNLVVKDGSEEKGPQEFTTFENNKGEAVTTGLEATQEGGKAKQSFLSIETDAITFEKATSIEK